MGKLANKYKGWCVNIGGGIYMFTQEGEGITGYINNKVQWHYKTMKLRKNGGKCISSAALNYAIKMGQRTANSCSYEIKWNANLMQLGNFIKSLNAELNAVCHLLALLGAHHIFHVSRITVNGILNSTCFGYIRPSSGALDVELHHMVFCTEFLDGWWSWEPLRRSCVRFGRCRACECGNEPSGSVKCGEFLD